MQKFAKIDGDGKVIGFYSPDVNEGFLEVSEGVFEVDPDGPLAAAIEISLADWEGQLSGIPKKWTGSLWEDFVETDVVRLVNAKGMTTFKLKGDCNSAIRAGWTSTALGTDHLYQTDTEYDQLNLIGAGLGGVDTDFTCTDATGTKEQRAHTAAQIRQVYDEAMAEKVRLIGVLHTLVARVEVVVVTTTVEDAIADIEAIVWTG